MKRPGKMRPAHGNRDRDGRRSRHLSFLAAFSIAGLCSATSTEPALAQPPQAQPALAQPPQPQPAVAQPPQPPAEPPAQPPIPFIPDITERSGLLMRFASSPQVLPPDPHRDTFYATRYADSGRIKHPNWVFSQGLYGLGLKTADTQSVYPFFYGIPGQSTIDASSKPWPRPLRFFQGLAHPFRPVGSYYAFGTYVPIYDLDPIAPGPGPYPYPFYFNWLHGG